ncbi:MAG: hypothetical protein AAB290_01325 [Candidatus Eisenbacteria bacterium]
MKNALAAALLVAALGAATPARAQVFGQFTGAATVPLNGHLFGAYLNASENVIGGLAQLRLSFYPNVDFGFHGGLTRLDPGGTAANLTTLRVGGDLRWRVAHAAQGSALDVAVGVALGVETADDLKVVSLGPSVVASRTLSVGDTGGIVPYAGLALLFSSRDAFGVEDSDISVPLRLGMEARLAPEFRIVAELQLFVADRYSDDVGFATGVNLPF